MEDALGLRPALEYAAQQERAAVVARRHPQGGEFVIIGKEQQVAHLPPLAPELHHIRQTVKLLDAASFVAYINNFKNEDTAVFADQYRNGQSLPPLIVGVIDYHAKPRKVEAALSADGKLASASETTGIQDGHDSLCIQADPEPLYCDHRVLFEFPFSEEWARWRAVDNKPLRQIEAAEFIEENFMDVVDPLNGVMLDIVTNLEAKKNVSFTSGVRLQTGANQLTYSEEVESKGRGTLTIPSEFKIGIPVFYGGPRYEVRVLMRYRIIEGALTFTFKINRRRFVESIAFDEVVKEIGAKTDIVPYFGNIA